MTRQGARPHTSGRHRSARESADPRPGQASAERPRRRSRPHVVKRSSADTGMTTPTRPVLLSDSDATSRAMADDRLATPVPVFVDPTGRRARRTRVLGVGAAATCALYLLLVAMSLVAAPGVLPLTVPGLGSLLPGPTAPQLSDTERRAVRHVAVTTPPTSPRAGAVGGPATSPLTRASTSTVTVASPTATPTPAATVTPTGAPTPVPTATPSPSPRRTGKPTAPPGNPHHTGHP